MRSGGNKKKTGLSLRKSKNREYRDLWTRPGYLIRRLHQIHLGLFAEECGGEDITPVQFGVLSVLQGGDEMDQLTLSASVGIDRTSGADVFRRLERKGLLTRRPSDTDGRAKLIKITDQGRKFVNRVRPIMARAQDRFVSPLSEPELEEFYRLVAKLIDANDASSRASLRFG
ncbi:MAG: MarR family winged helix-turn-helix transcriptional regulator [Parvibaculaceae bacterium]